MNALRPVDMLRRHNIKRQVVFSLVTIFMSVMAEAQNVRLDPSLEDIIRARLQINGVLTCDDLSQLTALNVDQRAIKTFAGLDMARNLTSLRITNCSIDDFNSIRDLISLKELHVRNCKIGDITAIGNLSGLSHLSLTDNEIEDVASLSKCTELAWLDMRHNAIDRLSALGTLHNLACVDVRDNPLRSSSVEADIRTLSINNPHVDVCLGPTGEQIDPEEIKERLSAKVALADFALFAQWHVIENYPYLPTVSPRVLNALLLLRRTRDEEYLADVALLLMRYATDILARYHTGTLLRSENPHPIVAEFLSEVPRGDLGGDELTTTAIAYWVCKNRTVLPPSLVLDAQMKRYQRLKIELDQKWLEDIRKVGGNQR